MPPSGAPDPCNTKGNAETVAYTVPHESLGRTLGYPDTYLSFVSDISVDAGSSRESRDGPLASAGKNR